MTWLRVIATRIREIFAKRRLDAELNEELRSSIMRNEDASKITGIARRQGMRNLREDGWIKIARGVTTTDEVMRVTQEF